MKILFIIKRRVAYGHYGVCQASGLFNSAKFVVDMLNASGRQAKLVEVTDNNDIDREVTLYGPDVVIIEALWVVPNKFDILMELHPNVEWIVRVHSNLPFIAHEGIAMEWLFGYLQHGVSVAFNSPRIFNDFVALTPKSLHNHILFLPNYYPTVRPAKAKRQAGPLRIGSFGAIRPLKNHLLQAVAAMRFAGTRPMEFHINGNRCEEGGEGNLKNLRALFAAHPLYTLVEHPWLNREEFLEVTSQMDYVLAASLSETFCITAADAVFERVPLVCSAEIPWASSQSIVPPTDSDAIVARLRSINRLADYFNWRNLVKYANNARKLWLALFPLSDHT